MSDKQFADLCEWWTPERIAAEEEVWQRDQFFHEYAKEVRAFAKKVKLKKGASVIEMGCGTGHVGRLLTPDFSYNGTDGSELMIAAAKKINPGIEFFVRNLRKTVEVDQVGMYDLLCCFAVLKHFGKDSWSGVLMNMLQLANYALIQVQVRNYDYPTIEDGTEVHHTWVNRNELIETVSKAGHEIIELRDTGKDVTPYMDNAIEAYLYTKRIPLKSAE